MDLKNYEMMSGCEASNNVGIKILVALPDGIKLSEKMTDEIKHQGYKLYEAIQLDLHLNDSDTIKSHAEEVAELKSLFDGPIFAEEIPNGYGPHGAPWLIVTTKVGHIKIGWRKRVINIDWLKTTNKTPGDVLFKEEETTKGGGYEDNKCYVHAWTLDREYLAKIMA